MDSELATSRDWAALQVYVASADRIANTLDRIWGDAESIWRPITTQTKHDTQVSTLYGCVWKFKYLSRAGLKETYIAVGVRFDYSHAYLSALPGRSGAPNFFVEFATEAKEVAFDKLIAPAGWMSSQGLWLVEKPVCELPTESDAFVVEAGQWARKRISEVVEALQARGG